jgi:hypothetical protein
VADRLIGSKLFVIDLLADERSWQLLSDRTAERKERLIASGIGNSPAGSALEGRQGGISGVACLLLPA